MSAGSPFRRRWFSCSALVHTKLRFSDIKITASSSRLIFILKFVTNITKMV